MLTDKLYTSTFEFETPAAVRKSIVSFSLVLIAFSNLDVRSDEIELAGLVIGFEKNHLIAFLKLSLWVSLASYFSALLPLAPSLASKVLKIRLSQWWAPLQEEIDNAYPKPPEDQYDEEYEQYREDNPDWDDLLYMEKSHREKKIKSIASLGDPISRIRLILTRDAWPIFLAGIALYFPEWIFILD